MNAMIKIGALAAVVLLAVCGGDSIPAQRRRHRRADRNELARPFAIRRSPVRVQFNLRRQSPST